MAIHVSDDLGLAGRGITLKKRCRLHDLTRLAIAALWHLLGFPR
jgi:hypothetical protein